MPRTQATARTAEVRSARTTTHVERFVVDGRVYRWEEGAKLPASERAIAPRETLAALFARTVVPQIERRGARGLVFEAAAPAGVTAGEVRWVAWRAPGDQAPVWGLYLAAHWLGESCEAPANDAFVLIAWGDGAALAWADERDPARAALRAALRVPPPWAQRGIRSRDATFRVSVDLVRQDASVRTQGRTALAVVPPATQRELAVQPATRESLLSIVRAWRAAHPATEPV